MKILKRIIACILVITLILSGVNVIDKPVKAEENTVEKEGGA